LVGDEPDAWREYGGVRWSRPVAFAAVALVLPLTAAQGGCTAVPERGGGRSGVTVIYVQSEASSAWPVQRAVSAWNSGLRRVRLRYGRCPVGETCIRVSEADLGRVSMGDGGRFGETSAFFGLVRLNRNARVASAHDRMQATCHELGHALGRPHRKEFSTCMHTYIEPGASTRPDAKDFAAVNARYGR
jgi:hypothetical protein